MYTSFGFIFGASEGSFLGSGASVVRGIKGCGSYEADGVMVTI